MAVNKQWLGNIKGPKGDPAKINSVTAEVTGEPLAEPKVAVELTGVPEDRGIHFNFQGLKGQPAGFGNVTAEADGLYSEEPTVEVTTGGTNEAKDLHFNFKGLRGPTGKTGTINEVTAAVNKGHLDQPTATVVVSGTEELRDLAFTFNGLQGAKGDKGDKGDSGADGINGTNGTNGTNGKDGYSPNVISAKHKNATVSNPWYPMGTDMYNAIRVPGYGVQIPDVTISTPSAHMNDVTVLQIKDTADDSRKSIIGFSISSYDDSSKTLSGNVLWVVDLDDLGGGGSGVGGTVIGPDKMILTGLSAVADATASEGKKVTLASSGATTKDVIEADFDVPFGSYSIVVRSKVAANTSAADAYQIVAYQNDTVLQTTAIKPNYYKAANKWQSIGVGVDYNGSGTSKLKVKIKMLSTLATNVDIDNITVMLAPVAINMIG